MFLFTKTAIPPRDITYSLIIFGCNFYISQNNDPYVRVFLKEFD
jgi:hypothetical protein